MMESNTAVVTLPQDTQILITREFDAPPEAVWRAWTTPDLIRRWWAGRRGEVRLAEVDLRVGGRWRYVMVAEGGFEVGFHGEYLEIEPPCRLVSTEVYEGMPHASARTTIPSRTSAAARAWSSSSTTPAGSTATRTSPRAWRAACRSR